MFGFDLGGMGGFHMGEGDEDGTLFLIQIR